jgi:hypothetical protein
MNCFVAITDALCFSLLFAVKKLRATFATLW